MYFEQKIFSFWLLGNQDNEAKLLIKTQPMHLGGIDAFLMGQSVILPVITWIISGIVGNCFDSSVLGWTLGTIAMLASWAMIPWCFYQERRAEKRWHDKCHHPRLVHIDDQRMFPLLNALDAVGLRLDDVGVEPYKTMVDQYFIEAELDMLAIKDLPRLSHYDTFEYQNIVREANNTSACMAKFKQDMAELSR